MCGLAGLAWYAWVTERVIPHFAEGRTFSYWSYERIGSGPGDALVGLLTRPFDAIEVFVTPRKKVQTMVALFGAVAFVPLASIELILAAPLIAERMFSSNAKYWTLQDHYSLTIAPVLAIGFARALPSCSAALEGRFERVRTARLTRTVPIAVATIAVASSVHFGAGDVLNPSRYRTPDDRRGAHAAVELIPGGASVAATNHLVPHLSQRARVELFGPGRSDAAYVAVEVAATSATAYFPFASAAARDRAVARLRRDHVRVFRCGGIEVWRRR